MKVELVYASGLRRDVTKYVTWSTAPLTEKDASFAISFPYVKYHDQDTDNGHETNVSTTTPFATVSLSISSDGTSSGALSTLSWVYDLKSGSLRVGGASVSGFSPRLTPLIKASYPREQIIGTRGIFFWPFFFSNTASAKTPSRNHAYRS